MSVFTPALSRRAVLRAAALLAGSALLGPAALAARPALAARATEQAPDQVPVRVAALKGPTAMGLVELMDEVDSGTLDAPYEFQILASSDEVVPLVAKGEVDVACIPANLASVLYNNTDGGVTALAVNTLGVLYLCSAGAQVASVADLAGATVYAAGKGATPEYALTYVLEAAGLDPERDVTVEWKSEHAECVAALLADPDAVALLPQPFVTSAVAANPNIQVLLDLNEAWEDAQDGLPEDERSILITGVAVARTAFVEENPTAVELFLERYAASVDFVNANVDEAAELVGAYGIVTAEVAQAALPQCNIVCITGAEMQAGLSGYLTILFGQNPKAVGGELPGDDFYFVPETPGA
jgi:NitT/TauT family transport system substrate-binding protein